MPTLGETFAAVLQAGYEQAGRRYRRAVIRDHAEDCGNNTCDITAALRAGWPRVAAYLLGGATETPTVDAIQRRFGDTLDMGHSTADDPDWLAWVEWFHANTVQCPGCEAFCFTDVDVYLCGNCGAGITNDGEWEPTGDGN